MRSLVASVEYYDCGFCTNNLGLVFKKHKREIRKFPAGAYLIHHSKQGLILFDTGYSVNICKMGLVGRLYNLFNPTTVRPTDLLVSQLKKQGIKQDDIKTIILSHLHPDHIGGLRDFHSAKIILSSNAMASYRKHNPRNLIMKGLFPDDFLERSNVVDSSKLKAEYDLFGDGSIKLLEMNGHARGQLVALINDKVLLAADTCWGKDLLGMSSKMKLPARIIQNDYRAYRETIKKLQTYKDSGIELMFSHDIYPRKELL